ncbi:Alpha/beta hydrolase family [Solimicrobium silvestre]|uniref:Alpha/beta hydrolase family n=2 Tax=Solimicrobium silvestre TaxID=2099400 RepID=A0A2S9H2B7_9BURK|nr:Alpha/beta hydrolase family [Solimicrobium silvestre]
MANMSHFKRLPSIQIPTKVIAGELDVSCPPELMRNDIAQQIPNARMHVIAGATHMISLTKPVELAALLLEK